MAEEQATPELKQYHGSCHCGAFKFSAKLAPLEKVSGCTCSLCFKVCLARPTILVFGV
ncbi:MAG: hypothetical protein Q9187_007232, partial [Circinaria calcarea]